MTNVQFSIKKFLRNALLVFVTTYFITFALVGVLWDPNGVILFERPIGNALMIVANGFLWCLPMGVSSFITNHPVPVIMGLGFFACLVVGFIGIKEITGRRLLYVLLSFLTVLGVTQFCLMA